MLPAIWKLCPLARRVLRSNAFTVVEFVSIQTVRSLAGSWRAMQYRVRRPLARRLLRSSAFTVIEFVSIQNCPLARRVLGEPCSTGFMTFDS